MALTPFARRPKPIEPPAPEPWPQIGETWKPEGVTIAERYHNQAHAVVLVYTADDGPHGTYYSVACLGCHYATRESDERRYSPRYCLDEAAKVANEHATTCRALPRDIPARPDDDTVRERLHVWVRGARHRDNDVRIRVSDLDLIRLTLQRTNTWIADALQQMVVDQPDLVRIEHSQFGDGVLYYYARQFPEN